MLIARVLLASVFVVSATDKFSAAPAEIKAIQALHLPAPAFLERLTGVCEVLGSAMLILGAGARLGAGLLAPFTLAVSFSLLRFWSSKGSAEAKQGQKTAFFGNMGVIGGLLLVAIIGPGSFALSQGL